MADLKHGHIFTTEPIAMRAFAAELRHDLDAAGRMVAAALGEDLGAAERIRCEAVDRERIDVVIEFAGQVEVGVEGKIGHAVKSDQTAREHAAVPHRLILLVKEPEDANQVALAFDFPLAVLTWQKALSYFIDPRITLEDVGAVKDTKRIARRALSAQDTSLLPDDWRVEHRDGTGGWPSITAWGPDLPDGRYLMLQIEMTRRDTGDTYAAAIGISVGDSEFKPFDKYAASTQQPAWIIHADRIGRFLQERLVGTPAAVSTAAARGQREAGVSKIAQAKHYGLPLKYAKGYVGDYLGVRTIAVAAADLEPFSAAVLSAAVELDEHLRETARARQ